MPISGDSVPVFDADLSLPLFLVVGGEKRGISRRLLDSSDLNVRIDYARDFTASLSAASAATVAGLDEVFRQNRVEVRVTLGAAQTRSRTFLKEGSENSKNFGK